MTVLVVRRARAACSCRAASALVPSRTFQWRGQRCALWPFVPLDASRRRLAARALAALLTCFASSHRAPCCNWRSVPEQQLHPRAQKGAARQSQEENQTAKGRGNSKVKKNDMAALWQQDERVWDARWGREAAVRGREEGTAPNTCREAPERHGLLSTPANLYVQHSCVTFLHAFWHVKVRVKSSQCQVCTGTPHTPCIVTRRHAPNRPVGPVRSCRSRQRVARKTCRGWRAGSRAGGSPRARVQCRNGSRRQSLSVAVAERRGTSTPRHGKARKQQQCTRGGGGGGGRTPERGRRGAGNRGGGGGEAVPVGEQGVARRRLGATSALLSGEDRTRPSLAAPTPRAAALQHGRCVSRRATPLRRCRRRRRPRRRSWRAAARPRRRRPWPRAACARGWWACSRAARPAARPPCL